MVASGSVKDYIEETLGHNDYRMEHFVDGAVFSPEEAEQIDQLVALGKHVCDDARGVPRRASVRARGLLAVALWGVRQQRPAQMEMLQCSLLCVWE